MIEITLIQEVKNKTYMSARILLAPKSPVQSGKIGTDTWILEFAPENSRFIEPVMGWTGNRDMMASQVKLKFPTKEAAVE